MSTQAWPFCQAEQSDSSGVGTHRRRAGGHSPGDHQAPSSSHEVTSPLLTHLVLPTPKSLLPGVGSQEDQSEVQQQVADLQRQLKEAELARARGEERCQEAIAARQELQTRLDETEQFSQETKNELEALQKAERGWTEERDSLRSKVVECEREKAAALTRVSSIEEAHQETVRELAQTKTALREMEERQTAEQDQLVGHTESGLFHECRSCLPVKTFKFPRSVSRL